MADEELQENDITWGSKSWSYLSSLRQQSPLIQCITNLISMDIMANTLLAAGASPAMTHSILEIPDFTPRTQAVLINVGTLTPEWVPAMKAAAGVANQLSKPWVLDPAAAGASNFRLKACLELIELKPTVIRGNGSEIISLSMASLACTKKLAAMADEELQENNLTWGSKSWTYLSSLREQSPLIQCITNLVSMDIMANTLLAAGASPAMIHSILEIPDFTPHTQAVLINVGTLTPEWLPAMKAAAGVANQLSKPWVLDPAAAGASNFRLKACLELIELKPTVIRGNGSEIISLSMASLGSTKGADSLHESSDAISAAKSVAKSSGSIVAISGSVDFVTDGQRVLGAHNGVPMMQKITASGCSVTALIAAFVAIDPTHAFEATISALSVFGLAGEIGMELAKGPASLRMHLIDSLYGLDQDTVSHRVNIKSFP